MIAKDILTLMFLVSGVSCLLLGLPIGAETDGISFFASRFVLLSSAGVFFLLSFYSSQRKE